MRCTIFCSGRSSLLVGRCPRGKTCTPGIAHVADMLISVSCRRSARCLAVHATRAGAARSACAEREQEWPLENRTLEPTRQLGGRDAGEPLACVLYQVAVKLYTVLYVSARDNYNYLV